MSVVHLPICPMCKWSMRLARICERGRTRVRVFECGRCHAELIWAPADYEPALSKDPRRQIIDAHPHSVG